MKLQTLHISIVMILGRNSSNNNSINNIKDEQDIALRNGFYSLVGIVTLQNLLIWSVFLNEIQTAITIT